MEQPKPNDDNHEAPKTVNINIVDEKPVNPNLKIIKVVDENPTNLTDIDALKNVNVNVDKEPKEEPDKKTPKKIIVPKKVTDPEKVIDLKFNKLENVNHDKGTKKHDDSEVVEVTIEKMRESEDSEESEDNESKDSKAMGYNNKYNDADVKHPKDYKKENGPHKIITKPAGKKIKMHRRLSLDLSAYRTDLDTKEKKFRPQVKGPKKAYKIITEQAGKKIKIGELSPDASDVKEEKFGPQVKNQRELRIETDLRDNLNSKKKFAKNNKKMGLHGLQIAFGLLSEAGLYVGFTVVSAFFAFFLATTPILFVSAVGLSAVFGLQAWYDVSMFINRKSFTKGVQKSRAIKFFKTFNIGAAMKKKFVPDNKTARFKCFSFYALGVGLILLGAALFMAPASFLGALAGLSLAAKVGVIAAGVVFFAKGFVDYSVDATFAYHCKKPTHTLKIKSSLSNVLNFVLYGACVRLGIAAMMTSGFAFIPAVLTAVFAMYAVASLLHAFDGQNLFKGTGRIARCLEAVALGSVGLTLLISGFAFAPALVSAFGLPMTYILFTKIASISIGVVCAMLAISKIWTGAKSSFFDFKSMRFVPFNIDFQLWLHDKMLPDKKMSLETGGMPRSIRNNNII